MTRWLMMLGLGAAACGGTAEGDGSDGSGGSSGSSSSSGGSSSGSGGSSSGSGGSSPGTGGSGTGGSGTGGSSTGGGHVGGGPGGSHSQAYEDCLEVCKEFSGIDCLHNDLELERCVDETCRGVGTRGAGCDEAFALAFRCFVDEIPVKCDSNGEAVLLCGPCDEELANIAESCQDDEIRCTF